MMRQLLKAVKMLYTLVKAVLRKYALYTLACENANSKLVEVVTVADVNG